jgi:hypothetical protein
MLISDLFFNPFNQKAPSVLYIVSYMELIILLGLLLPFLSYAEIHFRLPKIPSRLFQSEPEIILDLPYRAETGKKVPLFLIIKDAHQFPVTLLQLRVNIVETSTKDKRSQSENLEILIKENLFTHILYLDSKHFSKRGDYRIVATLDYLSPSGRKKSISQDNYRFIPHPPFKLYVSDEEIPSEENWYWGDLHNHSNYTDDQVEFGAPLESLAAAAESIGLNFLAVTDHSYDLDDHSENYLENDPNLGKWKLFQDEIQFVQKNHPNLVIVPGEEISTGNYKNQNIHCLFLNDPEFFPGNGDSAEQFWQNQPTLSLSHILSNKSKDTLAIAAHPLEIPPLSQRLILRRGKWLEQDLVHPELDALQILNGENQELLKKGLQLWSNLLLKGQHIGIVAGSDSHGNFNCFRQISIPFIKMVYSREHLFGSVKTGVFLENFSLNHLIKEIKQHRTIISNGPFATMTIQGKNSAKIGDTLKKNEANQLSIITKSSSEFGQWHEISLFWGNYESQKEIKKSITVDKPTYNFHFNSELLNNCDYVRLEAYSRKGEKLFFCITSPIWIE